MRCRTRLSFLKLFYVFNVDQIDELPEVFGAEVAPVAAEPSALEQWTARAGVRVRIGGSMACYAPVTDLVHMPAHEAFLSEEHWAATLLQEICNIASVIGFDEGTRRRPIGRCLVPLPI
ncbi:MAG: zincin-like metallopeptidase domain-containing protein [Terricaulis sp.]